MIRTKTYSLTQLNQAIQRHFSEHFSRKSFWVIAEISKISEKNGHRYLDLIDSVNGVRTAQISATLWASTYSSLREKLGNETNNILRAGNRVLFSLTLEFHPIYGLKLNLHDIDPSFSFGEIERIKQENIQKLKDEGIFDLQRQRYLPVISRRIALIGSPDTSGFRDFLDELKNNRVYQKFKVKAFPTAVQGDQAVGQIIHALKDASQYDVDAVVIIRGGGSKMDLHVFNDYELSRTICLSKIPVVTGIGHESDEMVADLVAHRHCITPTAAAKFFYIQIGVFSANLREAYDAVRNQAQALLSTNQNSFSVASNYLVHASRHILNENRYVLNRDTHLLRTLFLDSIHAETSQLRLTLQKLGSIAIHSLSLVRDVDLPAHMEKLSQQAVNFVQLEGLSLNNLEEMLRLLNPEKLLKNGYSLSSIDGVDIDKFEGDLLGTEMQTFTHKHLIKSTITELKSTKNGPK